MDRYSRRRWGYRAMVARMTLSLSPEMLRELAKFRIDEAQLAQFAARAADRVSTAVRGAISPLAASDTSRLPDPGAPESVRLAKLGTDALERGEVGVVVLAGGMATRFGGVVKSVVPVLPGKSFLWMKVADVRTVGPEVPVYVMTSAATHDRIVQQVQEERLAGVECFPQFVSLRLTPSGDLFLDQGKPSPYATGHGDLTFALRRSGVLDRFRTAGGKILYMSNVDNLAATLDPPVIGAHIASGSEMTAEVVRKRQGDAGGAPARLDGRPQIIESFRFPPSFDQDSLPLFNTNSFVLDVKAIDRDFDLTFFRVEKQVNGETAIQFERLVGELTAFLSSHFLEVSRSRFLPVKDPEELAARQEAIRALFGKIAPYDRT